MNRASVFANGMSKNVPSIRRRLDVRITDIDEAGACTWEEVSLVDQNNWRTVVGGAYGNPEYNPLYERNNITTIPTPIIVQAIQQEQHPTKGIIWVFDLALGGLVEIDVVTNVCPVDPQLADNSVTAPKILSGAALKNGDTFIGD